MRKHFVIGSVLVLATALGLGAAPARAVSNLICDGTVNGGTYAGLTVPAYTSCFVNNATITGSALVKEGARLETCQDVFKGSINAQLAYVKIDYATTIAGSVNVVPGVGFVGSATTCSRESTSETYSGLICSQHIGGAVTIHDGQQTANEFVIGEDCGGRLTINGQVSILRNPLPVHIEMSDIGNGITCKDNTPPATQSDNTVKGNIVGCADGGGVMF
jgi:hypothetical protein